MALPDRVHERELLDFLERLDEISFVNDAWRIVRKGRDPMRGAAAHGRWGAAGEFEVVYAAGDRDGALAEIGYRLGLEPIWPSKIAHEIHRLDVSLDRVLDLSDFAVLSHLGIEEANYESHDYSKSQAIAAAARFLGFQAILVPNARFPGNNLVVFVDQDGALPGLSLADREDVDWNAWRAANKARPSRRR